jgi:hypothetical protein
MKRVVRKNTTEKAVFEPSIGGEEVSQVGA